jgi:rubrerythrin
MPKITACEQVFKMAMEMEQVGTDFYAALAGGSDDVKVRTFCARVAGEEAKHLETFRRMLQEYSAGGHAHDVPPEAEEELRRLVAAQVQPDVRTVQKVALGGSLADALEMAMRMERDAIRFYQDLSAQVPAVAAAVRPIVKEEASHLSTLRTLAGQG